jgi:hypothetical protein
MSDPDSTDESAVDPGQQQSERRDTEPSTDRRRLGSRVWFAGALTCAGVLLLAAAWLIVTGLLAHSRLDRARSEVPQLRAALLAGDLPRARTLSADIRSKAHSAHALVSGPAWWVGANLPFAGTPLRTARGSAAAIDEVGRDALPGIVELAGTVTSLHSSTNIDLGVLTSAEHRVVQSRGASADAVRLVENTPSSSWLSGVDSSRAALLKQLRTLSDELTGANRALRTAIPMLGADGPRRYFLGFENEAELRGTGGLPGAFAIVRADQGKLTFTHFGSDTEFNGVHANVALGADYQARYSADGPTRTFANSNIGPDFRDAAQIWAAMWEKKSGEQVDGALAVDPTALSYILKVAGPAKLRDGQVLSAKDLVAVTQQGQYAQFANTARRKRYVVAVSKAVSSRITNFHGDTTALLKAVSRSASQRRILLYSDRPAEERDLIDGGYAGALVARAGTPFSGFVVVNAAGSKLDYYLDRTISYQRAGCAADSPAIARLVLHNDAPRTGLPTYVTTRGDHPSPRVHPGDNRLIVTYYGTPGARVTGVRLDGRSVGVAVGTEHGLVAVSLTLELPVQQSRTISVQLAEPAATASTKMLIQPGARDAITSFRAPACSGS